MRAYCMLAILCLAVAQRGDRSFAEDESHRQVTILAAASTTDAIGEIVRSFEQSHPSVNVRTSFGASSTLAQQIVAGARADVFLSASVEWADTLRAESLVADSRDLLGNRLVVIVPADSTLTIDKPEELRNQAVRHLALADPSSVPAGIYARAALERLGLWSELSPRVAAGSDVRQALDFVATGAAEAGIVYASDAVAQHRVRIACEFPPELSQAIRYPLVLLNPSRPGARALYDYIASDAASETFERYGFVVLQATGDSHRNATLRSLSSSDVTPGGWLSSEEWQALRLSLQVGICAVLLSLPLAVAAGYYLARGDAWGKWLLELVVNLPLVLPPVVTGFLLLMLLSPRGPLGGALESWFGVRIVFTWMGAALAAAIVSFPLMVRAIRLAFQDIDPRLEMAARSLGASRMRAFWTISLPLARRGLFAGCILAFARSLGEFGATIMVAGNIVGETQTIPLAIFSSANRLDGKSAVWRLVVLSILVAATALALSEWLERRYASREAA